MELQFYCTTKYNLWSWLALHVIPHLQDTFEIGYEYQTHGAHGDHTIFQLQFAHIINESVCLTGNSLS